MTKALFLDLDGTVISSNYQVSKKNIKAIKKIKKAVLGILYQTRAFVLNTCEFAKLAKNDYRWRDNEGKANV